MEIVRRVLPYLRPYRWQFAAGLAALVLSTPASLIHPMIWRFVVDEVIIDRQVHLLAPALVVTVLVQVVASVLSGVHVNFLEKAGQRFVADLRAAVYEKLQRQSVAFHHNSRTGDLLARAINDIDALQDALVRGLDQVLGAALRFLFVVGAILYIHPVVGSLTLVPLAVVWVLVRVFNRHVKSIYRAVRDRLGDVSAQLQENLVGHMVIKAFAREETAMERFRQVNRFYVRTQDRAIRARSVFLPTVHFIGFLSSVVMIGVGAVFTLQGTFTVGGIVAYRGYWWQLFSPIEALATVNELLQRAMAAGSRVFELLDSGESVRDAPGAIPVRRVRGDVALENVSFSYGREPVLQDVSLTVPAGRTVAMVGPSGAGKSSLLYLVPRFYDPEVGRVLVDGRDVRTLEQRSLRRHMAMVLQETILFNGTVAENIRFSRPEASDEEVRQAARMANAHDFIESLPEGYDTLVGERGVKLSGGQRQRIAISRAFLADPRILILDEATSSVEPESEWIIQQTLEHLMRGRTTLLTSHRLSMVRNADLIVVLDGGRIVEQGTHRDLLALGGLYAEMHALQTGHLAETVGREG